MRKLLVAAFVALLASITVLVSPASAAPLDITCVGTTSTSYSPPLTLDSRATLVTETTILSPCVSATTPAINAGVSVKTTNENLSCLSLGGGGFNSQTISWSNVTTSNFGYNSTVTTLLGSRVVTKIGVIGSGTFATDTAVLVLTSPALNLLDCTPLGGGISVATGTATLEITSVM
ncbi:hypothetical protein [Actinosynnema sp. NPDC020468]|uniref:hypothetical protein n=1 Tax=Actinosynnema sp. NPDC020468 TaxID=3154488 RepID=UPI0033CB4E5E